MLFFSFCTSIQQVLRKYETCCVISFPCLLFCICSSLFILDAWISSLIVAVPNKFKFRAAVPEVFVSFSSIEFLSRKIYANVKMVTEVFLKHSFAFSFHKGAKNKNSFHRQTLNTFLSRHSSDMSPRLLLLKGQFHKILRLKLFFH